MQSVHAKEHLHKKLPKAQDSAPSKIRRVESMRNKMMNRWINQATEYPIKG
uniref:Uncharacterized protein n=1 Tax=Rhizophora mucronata TaxID=61149 RepID=A0A2P2P680_RHIMU